MTKKQNVALMINICLVVALLLTLCGIFLWKSGSFDDAPRVEAVAKNCYDETLYVITDDDYSPYSFYGTDGSFQGHDVELIALLANELEMNLDLTFLPWNEGIIATCEGKTDVLMTCDYSDTFQGVDTLLKSEPVSTDEFIVYSKSDIQSSNELYNLRCAVMENGNVLAPIAVLNLENSCLKYPNNRAAMDALEEGRVDCAIMRYTVGESLLKERRYRDIKSTVSIGQSYMCFGIAKEDTELVDKLNAAIEKLKVDGTIDRLQSKWLTGFVHTMTVKEFVFNNVSLVILFILLVIGVLLVLIRSEEKKIRQEKAVERKLTEDKILLDYFIDAYTSAYSIDLTDDSVQVIRMKNDLSGMLAADGNKEGMKHFINEYVHPDDRELMLQMIDKMYIVSRLRKERSYSFTVREMYDNRERTMRGIVIRGIDEWHVAVGFMDITDEVEKEKQIQRSLSAASKAKSDFLFNMSHDIRTPMNAITGFTDLACKNMDNREKVADYLGKIKNASDHLLTLINEVLDMSRIEAGKLTSTLKTVSITEEANRMIAICKEAATEKKIKLSLFTEVIQHENVLADELHVNRIITNIIGNAIKYTMPGGNVLYSIKEVPSEHPQYGKYEFTIEDNGIGMSEEFLETIFDSFSREDSEAVRGIQGTGLGMAIVKRLVDYLDGTIEITSRQGKGTKVTLEFHFRLAKDNVTREEELLFDMDLSGKRVLLVEDNELNREIATEILKERGIFVESAGNGREAVGAVKRNGPAYYDIILMDIQMPFMNGYEATAEIRKLPGADRIKIIALSANAFDEDRQRSIMAGMNEHIAKPIHVPKLMRAIAAMSKSE